MSYKKGSNYQNWDTDLGECIKYINLEMLTELPFTRLRNEQHRFEDIMAHFIKL